MLEKMRAMKITDLQILILCVIGFGMVFLCEYEERWYRYRTTNLLGKPPYKMIPIRRWTPLDKLPAGNRNYGDAAYDDEYTLHEVAKKFNLDVMTHAGTDTCAMAFLNMSAESRAKSVVRQNEMKLHLLNALLYSEYVGDVVRFWVNLCFNLWF
jgi:hypothetical protein